MTELATAFIQKMKTRDMRKPIREDFAEEDLRFEAEDMMNLIKEEGLPLDFIYDAMVCLC